MPSDLTAGVGYALEVPQGWEAIERPGADIELVVTGPELDGRVTVLNVERFVRDEQTPPDAVDRLLTGRVEGLLETMVDALLLDVVAVGAPRGAVGPGLRATVAYRHGPVTVTAFAWVFETEQGAFLLSAAVEADLLAVDGPVLEGIVGSLELAVVGAEPSGVVEPSVSAAAVRDAGDLPGPPAGWGDADSGADPGPRRFLVRDAAPGMLPVTLSSDVIEAAADEDPETVHARAVDQLAITLTDATLVERGSSALAGEPAIRSSVWFRHGSGNRFADVWTSGPVVAWSIAQVDDDAGRDAAAEVVAGATLELLGCEAGDAPAPDAAVLAKHDPAVPARPEDMPADPFAGDAAGDAAAVDGGAAGALAVDGAALEGALAAARPYDGVSVALRLEDSDGVVSALAVIDGAEVVVAIEGDRLGDGGPHRRPAAGLPIELASLVSLGPRPAPDQDPCVLLSGDAEVAESRAALLAGWPAELAEGTVLAAGDDLVLWSAIASWDGPDGEPGARAVVVADGGDHGIAFVESRGEDGVAIVPCTSTDVWGALCALLPRRFELA